MDRRAKLVLLLFLVAVGGGLAYAGAAPEGYKSVAQVATDPAAFEGRDVAVKATVLEGSLRRDATPVSFEVVDERANLRVRWDPALPLPDHEAGGTIEGKSVVVHGVLMVDDEGPYLLAREMQVGCASKYRPEDAA